MVVVYHIVVDRNMAVDMEFHIADMVVDYIDHIDCIVVVDIVVDIVVADYTD